MVPIPKGWKYKKVPKYTTHIVSAPTAQKYTIYMIPNAKTPENII